MNSPRYYLEKATQSSNKLASRYLRRLSKELVIFLPVILLLVLGFNFFSKTTVFEKTKNKASKNPKNFQAKLVLGDLLLQNNNLDSSQKEFQKIIFESPDPILKAEALKKLQFVERQKQTPLDARNELVFWQSQNQKYPGSRDTLLKIAVLNWKLYRLFEASKFLNLAAQIDPNNSSIEKVKTNLELN